MRGTGRLEMKPSASAPFQRYEYFKVGREHGDGVDRLHPVSVGAGPQAARSANAQSLHNMHNREQKNYCRTAVVYGVRGVQGLRRTIRRNIKTAARPRAVRPGEVP